MWKQKEVEHLRYKLGNNCLVKTHNQPLKPNAVVIWVEFVKIKSEILLKFAFQ